MILFFGEDNSYASNFFKKYINGKRIWRLT